MRSADTAKVQTDARKINCGFLTNELLRYSLCMRGTIENFRIGIDMTLLSAARRMAVMKVETKLNYIVDSFACLKHVLACSISA